MLAMLVSERLCSSLQSGTRRLAQQFDTAPKPCKARNIDLKNIPFVIVGPMLSGSPSAFRTPKHTNLLAALRRFTCIAIQLCTFVHVKIERPFCWDVSKRALAECIPSACLGASLVSKNLTCSGNPQYDHDRPASSTQNTAGVMT